MSSAIIGPQSPGTDTEPQSPTQDLRNPNQILGRDNPNPTPSPADQNHALHDGGNELEPEDGGKVAEEMPDTKTNPRTIEERLAMIESQNTLIDRLFGLNQSLSKPEIKGKLLSSEDPLDEDDEEDFIMSTVEMMTRMNRRYRKRRFSRQNNDSPRSSNKNDATTNQGGRNSNRKDDTTNQAIRIGHESELAKQVSTEAWQKGEPAKISHLDWQEFILRKGHPDESILEPIDMVFEDPEVELMDLPPSKENKPGRRETWLRPALPRSPEWALPDRIRIHSHQLFHIFGSVIANDHRLGKSDDKAMVFRHPFRTLVHHEQQLRGHLSRLERHFENYGRKDHNPYSVPEREPTMDGTSEPSSHVTTTDASGDAKSEKQPSSASEDSDMTITSLLHLRCLMRFIDEELKPKVDFIRSGECRRLLFRDLWYLFKPGDEVVDQEEKQAYRVVEVALPRHWVQKYSASQYATKREMRQRVFTITCVNIDFDGGMFGPVMTYFYITAFSEMRDITTLPVYPLRFAQDRELRQSLVKRGMTLLDASNFKSMYYNGLALDRREEIDSQVVVDFKEALAHAEYSAPRINTIRINGSEAKFDKCTGLCCMDQPVHNDDYVDTSLTHDFVRGLLPRSPAELPSLILSPRALSEATTAFGKPTEEEFVLMTYRVFGFILRSRKWAELDLSYMSYEDPDVNRSTQRAFDSLELPKGHREMVESLVTQHFREKQSTRNSSERTDLIKGKGKGLILLLHGAPGVGKTTTAEGVAEMFERPLFHITCGDLGTTAKEVEAELEKNFSLASRWGCILLLDEADVFLCARDRRDFARNGLVAVFLRILEYYTGVLFLTTNRLGDFDEAFASRIHISLFYPELDRAKTRKVFKLNLELIKRRFLQQGREIKFDEDAILKFAARHFKKHQHRRWNGRQIRNACQTALALAEYDSHGGRAQRADKALDGVDKSVEIVLELKHFETVQQAYLDFARYLGEIRGTPEEGDTRAFEEKLRARPSRRSPAASSAHAYGQSGYAAHDGLRAAGNMAHDSRSIRSRRSQMKVELSDYDDDDDDDDDEDEDDDEQLGMQQPSQLRTRAVNHAQQQPSFQPIFNQGFTSGPSGMNAQFPQQGYVTGNNMAFANQQGYSGQQTQMGYQQNHGWNPAVAFNPSQGPQGQGQFGFGNGQQMMGGNVPPSSQAQGQFGSGNGQQGVGGQVPISFQGQGQFGTGNRQQNSTGPVSIPTQGSGHFGVGNGQQQGVGGHAPTGSMGSGPTQGQMGAGGGEAGQAGQTSLPIPGVKA